MPSLVGRSLQFGIVFVRIGDSFYTFPVVQSPEDIRLKLIRLIQEAQSVSPNLASRLDEMRRWIAHKKSGLLMRKRHVMALLTELIEDADFWLAIQSLPEQDKDAEFAQLSQAEQYWYKYLFPAWFNEPDPKLNIWKQNLMAEKFEGSDAPFIERICKEIELCGGDTCNPYIADLSMATDLIASGKRNLALCVQLTSIRDSLATGKRNDWNSTLIYWKIERGLFIGYNPMQNQVSSVGECVFRHSDQLPEKCYFIVSLN